MVEKIAPTSPTSPSSGTQVNHSTSIGSEPDRAWVAARQAQITANIKKMNEERAVAHRDENSETDGDDGNQSSERHLDHHSGQVHPREENVEEKRLSGESARIGTGNLDENAPFGEHLGFV
ncbi:hypothetical protein [Rhizobium binxianense]